MPYAITQIIGTGDCTHAERNVQETQVPDVPFAQMLSTLLGINLELESFERSESNSSEDAETLELLSTEEGEEATLTRRERSEEEVEGSEEDLYLAALPWIGAPEAQRQQVSQAEGKKLNVPEKSAVDPVDTWQMIDVTPYGARSADAQKPAKATSSATGTHLESLLHGDTSHAEAQNIVAPLGLLDEAWTDARTPELPLHTADGMRSRPSETAESASTDRIDMPESSGFGESAKRNPKQEAEEVQSERAPYAPASSTHAPITPETIPAKMTESATVYLPIEQQIVEGIQVADSVDGVKELSLDLHPKELGRIHIKLKLDEQKLVVCINSKKSETQRLLGARLDTLIARLELKDARIELVQSDGTEELFMTSTHGQEHHAHRGAPQDSRTSSRRQRAGKMPSGDGTMRGPTETASARQNIRPAGRRLDRTI